MDLTTLFDASAVVSTLGLIGVLGIIFMETGLLIGLVFPGGEVVFLAGMAASSAGADVLGNAKLSTPLLFLTAPIAAIVGGEVGYWFGKKYGRKFFERPDTRFFNQNMVRRVEKLLAQYGPRKALVFGRFIPFVRTLLNPTCGVVAMGIGYLLGEALGDTARSYMYIVVGVIVLITLIPMAYGLFKEWRTKHHLS